MLCLGQTLFVMMLVQLTTILVQLVLSLHAHEMYVTIWTLSTHS